MPPVNVSEASVCFGGVIPLEAEGESYISRADISALHAIFEHDSSSLLLDDSVFGFLDGSLFPTPAIDATTE